MFFKKKKCKWCRWQ